MLIALSRILYTFSFCAIGRRFPGIGGSSPGFGMYVIFLSLTNDKLELSKSISFISIHIHFF